MGRERRIMPVQTSEPAPALPPSGSAPSIPEIRWRFGTFVVWETQRRLERLGQAVRLGPRTFDLMLQLLANAGEFIGKDELLSTVWPDVVVEEASVRVHMSLLRKALGKPGEDDGCKEWITNVPLRGYRFNGKVIQERATAERGLEHPDTLLTKVPVRLTGLVGRDADVADVLASLGPHRLVTIVGPGGIGKTSVAIRAAEHYQRRPAMQVAFVDLAPLISPDHVLGTMARSLGVSADLPDPIQAVAQGQAGKDILLLIDNCEHVVDSLAPPVERLLASLPGLRILATSREALRVPGEYVLRLSALATPDVEHVTLAQALQWPSVELLVERAKAAGAGAFDESDGPVLARISRQLEGIPLAIELVAARLSVQPAGDLAHRLDNHMRLLSISNRVALERHRSLAAALDWSIALLSEDELRIFRRLSIFRGRFDVESALGVAAGDMDQDAAFDALISLANKSLVFFDGNDAIAPYRLLDTTRSYGAALLAKSDDRPELLRRHTMFMLDLMTAATSDLPNLTAQAWGDRYAHHLDDVRFALDVCLSEQTDTKAAASLVTASAPLWFHLSQVAEYRDRVAGVLALVERQSEPDPETETWLLTALIIALLHTDGSNPGLGAICDRAIAGALSVNSRVLELQSRWGRCTHEMFRGEYAAALQHAETLLATAQSWAEPAALNLAHRVSAMAHHFCGRFEEAKEHCGISLQLSDGAVRTRTNMVGVDPSVAAMAMLARTLWIQGETTKALETASDAIERAETAGHTVSLCAGLYGACPVALWSGELALAERWIRMMTEEARRKGLVGWLRYAEWFSQGLRTGVAPDDSAYIREVSDQFAAYDAPRREMLTTFCPEWVDDEMISRLSRGEGLWGAPEVWRAVGWRSEQRARVDEAESFYRKALETSRQQGAKAWELRAAQNLARLWATRGHPEQAMQLLEKTCQSAPDSSSLAVASARRLYEEIKHPTSPKRKPRTMSEGT
jgi:predicted ATPase/DNA-binding winged helix-turn-helix (wHTH) protein